MEFFQEATYLRANFSQYESKVFARLKSEYVALLDGKSYEYYQEKKALKRQEELNKKLKQIEDFYFNPQKRKEMFPLEIAREIMGESFYGPEEIEKAFGFEADSLEIPALPYSFEELEKAKERGEFLILRQAQDDQARSMTMRRINDIIQPRWTPDYNRRLISNYDLVRSQGMDFFEKDCLKTEWKLVGGSLLNTSVNQSYFHQTKDLRNFLKSINALTVEDEQACSNEVLMNLSKQDGFSWTLQRIVDKNKSLENDDWVVNQLVNLPVNIKYRRSIVEMIYDFVVTGINYNFSGFVHFESSRCLDGHNHLLKLGQDVNSLGAIMSAELPSAHDYSTGVVCQH